MPARYILSPRAVQNLLDIWNYIKDQSSASIADQVELSIRERMIFLAGSPGAGHRRKDLKDLTDEDVRFFGVYSYLIAYSADTKPLQITSIIHGRRDVTQVLKERT